MATLPTQEDIKSGQAIYTKNSLLIYDLFVTRFSNRFVWQCPRQVLISFFKDNISKNHLDIGVGTGYFLQQLNLIPGQQRIGLLDMNPDCLAYTKQKLKELNPEVYQYSVFEPFTGISKKFDSVSLNYVLHCLPGDMQQKAVVFDHIKAVLNPGGKLFGTAILGKDTEKNWLAKTLLNVYNDKKIMHNLEDDFETLQSELKKRFSSVQVKMNGCVALFVASL